MTDTSSDIDMESEALVENENESITKGNKDKNKTNSFKVSIFQSLLDHKKDISCITFSTGDKYLVAASLDKNVYL